MNLKNTVCLTLTLASVVTLTGCGGGKDDVVAPPPPPPAKKTADITANSGGGTATVAPVAGHAAATEAPPAGGSVAAPPPDPATGTNNIFKGLTAREIEDYKQNATPETHDLNLNPIQEAAYAYYKEYRRAPRDQKDLVEARYLQRVLTPPKGKKYVFDEKTAQVQTVAQ